MISANAPRQLTFGSIVLRFPTVLLTGLLFAAAPAMASSDSPGLRKVEDITVYRGEDFYSAFPSIIRRPNGELIVAFRRAPNRRRFGGGIYSHSDPNSYLVSVRSQDSGRTWTREPQLIYAHPLAGSQDPCMVQLRDQSILCTSYAWALLAPEQIANLQKPIVTNQSKFVFLGGFILRSTDGAHSWHAPIIPAAPRGENELDIFGNPLPARSRGALCEGADGRLYWVVQTAAGSASPRKTEVHLMISEDRGLTWNDSAVVASDPKIGFNETSLYETPKGDLVAFVRTGGLDGNLVLSRSSDKGRSFTWKDTGVLGFPAHAIRLPDQRVLLVYGYRRAPWGIRARLLDPECTNIATAPEVILRDDGGNGDLGYPWASIISDKRALVVYYFNKADGLRTIESTVVEFL